MQGRKSAKLLGLTRRGPGNRRDKHALVPLHYSDRCCAGCTVRTRPDQTRPQTMQQKRAVVPLHPLAFDVWLKETIKEASSAPVPLVALLS